MGARRHDLAAAPARPAAAVGLSGPVHASQSGASTPDDGLASVDADGHAATDAAASPAGLHPDRRPRRAREAADDAGQSDAAPDADADPRHDAAACSRGRCGR
jgi:hypothetical protein